MMGREVEIRGGKTALLRTRLRPAGFYLTTERRGEQTTSNNWHSTLVQAMVRVGTRRSRSCFQRGEVRTLL
jgi:hypothetical protein